MRATHHALIYFIVRVANGVLSLATVAVLTRIMSAKDYGVYCLGVSAATIVSTFLYNWLNISLGRFYPAHQANPIILFQTINRLFWFVSLVVFLVSGIALVVSDRVGLKPDIILIVALIVLAQSRYGLGLQLTNAIGKPMQYGLVSCAKSLVTLVVSAGLISAGIGSHGALTGVLVGFAFAAMIFCPKGIFSPILGRSDWQLIKQIYHYGIPFTWTLLAITVVDVSDRFIISKYLGVAKVAPYAAAYDFSQYAIGMILSVLFLSSFPAIIKAFESDGVLLAQKKIRTLGQGFLFIAPAAVVGLGALSKDIAQVIFGPAIQKEAAQILPWIAVSVLVAGFKSFYLDITFQLMHSTRLQAATAIVMAVVNLGLNFVLIPLYGIMGAAWATLAAFLIGAAVSAYFALRIFPLPALWKDSWKMALALLPMLITLLLFPVLGSIIGIIGKILLSSCIYLVTAWVLDLSDCRNMSVHLFSKFADKK